MKIPPEDNHTDTLTHEWVGGTCKYGCLCSHSARTHGDLCPNRVNDLQKRYAQLKIEFERLRNGAP